MTGPLIVIPARLQATRLPGKPLADIAGRPMIAHVVERALEARCGSVAVKVAVATDSGEIAAAAQSAGATVVMTRADHASGSDRVWEAVCALDPGGAHEVIVNLQGDLPALDPDLIQTCIAALGTGADIATLAAPITDDAERTGPNVVKAVGTPIGDAVLRALYFTRATAPWGDGPLWHHIGIYAYRRAALERFVSLSPSPLETREKLEQLRALEAGMTIHVGLVDTVPLGVDTPADLERARRLLSS